MTKIRPTEPVASIPLPSADLINFRFDSLEKAQIEQRNENKELFSDLNNKLDYMSETFITRTEFQEARETKDKEHREMWAAIKAIRTNMKWWATWIVASLGVSAAVIDVIIKIVHIHTK